MKYRGERREVRDEEKEQSIPSSQLSPLTLGSLYVVATPIGNLEDITLRALRILKEVDFILCEDKRVTSRLLNKYQIKSRLISFHKFNEAKMINYVLSLLTSGRKIALVSDSGTPLISDPGSILISEVQKNNIKLISVPGPSALIAALSLFPYRLEEFLFVGFLPEKKSKREALLTSLKKRAKVVFLFIAPHDLHSYLKEISTLYSEVNIFYARELTKIHEEFWFGKITNLIEIVEKKKLKGEIILGICFNVEDNNGIAIKEVEVINRIKNYINKGFSLKETSKILAKQFNLSSKSLYDLYLKEQKSKSKN